MVWYIIIPAGLVLFLLVIVVYYINKLYILSNRIDNAWAQIDVQLKKRADLVPNLMETVKGYMKHEKTVFENVTKARTSFMNAKTTSKMAEADNMLSGALKSLFAVAENYPKLRANENFLMLQEELSGIENKIAYARQFYNDTTLSFNNAVTTIPGRWFASLIGKRKPKEFFQVEASERKPVKVKF